MEDDVRNSSCQNSEAVSESVDEINVQFTSGQVNFFAGVGIQGYHEIQRVEWQTLCSITNNETLEHESDRQECGKENQECYK